MFKKFKNFDFNLLTVKIIEINRNSAPKPTPKIYANLSNIIMIKGNGVAPIMQTNHLLYMSIIFLSVKPSCLEYHFKITEK